MQPHPSQQALENRDRSDSMCDERGTALVLAVLPVAALSARAARLVAACSVVLWLVRFLTVDRLAYNHITPSK
ncbi:MAG: hypothetical protein H6823_02795 [Planctomycetaceae bacterium]|nr:hypothetical protein [Planctomycetaceae bacterium]